MIKTFKKIITHPIFIASAILLVLHVFNITRYDFIADKDSYTWILKYSDYLEKNSVYFYRQLFSTLIFSLHYLTGLDLFPIFKYLFPLFSITAILPLWLLARRFANTGFQLVMLLMAIASPTIIIQFEGTRPQIMAMLYIYFLLGLSIIAYEKKNINWLYGIFIPITVIGLLFHRIFVIFLALWIIAAIYTYRSIIAKNKAAAAFFLVLLFPWLEKLNIRNMAVKIFIYSRDIFLNIFIHPAINLKFPAYYTNIDGKQMGWANLGGVAKYYAFYIGPFLGIIILSGLFILFKSKRVRGIIKDKFELPYFLPIFLFIGFFIFIAEILPRLGNIAFLPDRAWIFLGILSSLLFLPFYRLLRKSIFS